MLIRTWSRCCSRHGAKVNDMAPDGTSALNMAVVNAYFDLASFLLDHGADPNAPDPRGSALHTLAWLRRPGYDGAAGVGGVPHGRRYRRAISPPLSWRSGCLSMEQILTSAFRGKKKFDKEGGTTKNPPNIQLGRHLLSYVGATPFYVAARGGDAVYMRLLVAHGADPKLPTVHGITPLMAAAGLGHLGG